MLTMGPDSASAHPLIKPPQKNGFASKYFQPETIITFSCVLQFHYFAMGLNDMLTTGLILAATCLAPVTARPPPPPAGCADPLPRALVPQGTVEGFRDEYCNAVYLGVPFAASTGGQNRYGNVKFAYETMQE
jgi:hypothetical protein